MKVTVNWLKDYVDFDLSPENLAHQLTMVGLEVEQIVEVGAEIAHVVVGHVDEHGKHPAADKLSVCKVNDGSQVYDVVCGAPNVAKGQNIAFARVGSTLPGFDGKLKKAKIRGQVSEGMICSERELGMSDEHEGILVLPEDSALGESIVDTLGIRDWVLDLGLTPNRGDCLGVIGVAREVAAIVGAKLKMPDADPKTSGEDATGRAKVRINDLDGCPRYIARIIDGITIGPSPKWMQRRLEAVGLRPISNVVDVTNYVLMELGQPLHAFDLSDVAGSTIIVRRAEDGEALTTLDEVERKLAAEDLVIADAKKPVALAGVMGGMGSGVRESTTSVLLESAYFDPTTIRRSSRRHQLSSDSSYRFERGVDPGGTDFASRRAALLMAEAGGGSVAPGFVEVSARSVAEPRTVVFDLDRANHLLGTSVAPEEADTLLSALGFERNDKGIQIPTWRSDISRSVDIAEELARRVGYDNIPEVIPVQPLAVEQRNVADERAIRAREILCSLGFYEAVHMSFASPDDRRKLGLTDADPANRPVTLLKPLSEEEGELRTMLLPSLLRLLARNIDRARVESLRAFEMRHVFRAKADGELPDERQHVGGLLAGHRRPRIWDGEPPRVDFFDAKGVVDSLLRDLGHPAQRWTTEGLPPFLVPGAAAWVFGSRQAPIGWLGEIDPEVLASFDLEDRTVFAFELDFGGLLSQSDTPVFEEIPKYPAAVRDLAIVVDESVSVGAIVETVQQVNPKLIETVEVFDVYRGEQVGDGKKSVALSITYRDSAKTLTDKAVGKIHDKAVKRLTSAHGAELRA